MKISGFTMGKNVSKLYYPIRQAIESILPICDEFVVALGDSDEDDASREEILKINSPKIRIVDTTWDIQKYPRGMENAHQTDIAKSYCTGDWLFYVQADEVVHEKDLPGILANCEKYLNDKEVEGFVFDYYHFWGDYQHYHFSHKWYKHEIRIIRNDPEIHSWESAQSFRRIPDFDGLNYRQQEGTYKLKVVKASAHIYHYGWVRPPRLMRTKNKALDTIHKGKEWVEQAKQHKDEFYDYGPLNRVQIFKGTHPAVMKDWMQQFNWGDQLQYSGPVSKTRKKHKHEHIRYRVLTWIENHLLGGRNLGGFKNYILLNKK